MKSIIIAPNASRWLLAAAFAFATLAGVSVVQLHSQVASLNAEGCNVYLCVSDSDCQIPHPLCASCQLGKCSTIF